MHGNTAAKYLVAPCKSSVNLEDFHVDSILDKNFLRTNLQNTVSKSASCFTLSAQFYKDDKTTPIEDATVDWPTPWIDLARIVIPTQTIGTQGQDNYCRWLAYNPWHTLPEHAPLGVVQRIRSSFCVLFSSHATDSLTVSTIRGCVYFWSHLPPQSASPKQHGADSRRLGSLCQVVERRYRFLTFCHNNKSNKNLRLVTKADTKKTLVMVFFRDTNQIEQLVRKPPSILIKSS